MSHPTNLETVLAEASYPKMSPHPIKPDQPAEWLYLCIILCQRHLHERESLPDVCRDLKIDVGIGSYFVALIGAHAGRRIGPMVCSENARDRAYSIGRAMYHLARWDAPNVRHILATFAAAATSDRQIVLSPPDDPCDTQDPVYAQTLDYAEALSNFVRVLRIEGLGVRLTGYDSSQVALLRLDKLKVRLRLSTPVRIVKPHNASASSAKRQIGMEVVRQTESNKFVVDGAFWVATILAVVVDAWRFAVRDDPSIVKPGNQPISAPPAPLHIHPWSKLPPAVLLGPPFGTSGNPATSRRDSPAPPWGRRRSVQEIISDISVKERKLFALVLSQKDPRVTAQSIDYSMSHQD